MKRTPLTIIFLIVFIDLLGFGVVIPIIPSYAEHGFAASDFTIGLLVASFSFAQLLFTPLWGRLSDRYGRKPILLIGLVMTVVSYIMFGMAESMTVLFVSRLLGGIGGANISAAQAYIADVTRPEERAKGMGMIGAAFGLGFVFGPIIGGLLVGYGYSVPGYAAAVLSAIALVTAMIALPESLHRNEQHDGGRTAAFTFAMLLEALKRPYVGALLLLFFLITFGYANIYATFPMISTRKFGMTDREVGYLFGFMGIVGAFTQGYLIRVLGPRIEERKLFLWGSMLTAIGLFLLPFSISTFTLLAILAVLSLGTGLVTPSCLGMISRYADPAQQGGVLGINQALGALGRVLGPIWGAFVFDAAGMSWPFITGGIVLTVVALLVWREFWPAADRSVTQP